MTRSTMTRIGSGARIHSLEKSWNDPSAILYDGTGSLTAALYKEGGHTLAISEHSPSPVNAFSLSISSFL